MKHLLDTNACVAYLRGRNPLLRTRFLQRSTTDIVVCSIVVGELFTGAEGSRDPIKARQQVEAFLQPYRSLPFDDDSAREYSRIRHDLERRGLRIGDCDMQIAAIALLHGLSVVTHNTIHFSRVPGLTLEDWELP